MVAICMAEAEAATAAGNSAAGTMFGSSAWVVGISKARALPSRKAMTKSSSRLMPPLPARISRLRAIRPWPVWQRAATLRRSKRSATWPVSRMNRTFGRNSMRPTRPRSSTLPVRLYICQPMATVSIWKPLAVNTRANQKARKGRWWRSRSFWWVDMGDSGA
ncbi:hypothetical protein D9M68_553630 [compost metagenome]